jgi:hypothetical protein
MAIPVYVIDRLNIESSSSEADSIKILVSGITKCAGCKIPRLNPKFTISAPPPNGIYEFDFIADCDHPEKEDEEHIPTGDVLYYFKDVPANMKKIVVYAEKNMKEISYSL